MIIQPDSTITLYKNIPIDNGEQLVFKSPENQYTYFTDPSRLVATDYPCTVVRKTGKLRIEVGTSNHPSYVNVSECNYLSFINPSMDNKRVYARIVDYDYVNNECCEISYVIDFWQTWMFDVHFDDTYIEREHLSQADYTLSQQNPFDPDIYEFRTAEELPISKDIEKPHYEIGNGQNSDGFFIAEYAAANIGVNSGGGIGGVENDLGCLIVFSEIDFENLDSETSMAASQAFANILSEVIANGFGFYELTAATSTYMMTHWSTPGIGFGQSWSGLGAMQGTQFVPFAPMDGQSQAAPFASTFKPPCNYIYVEYGASYHGASQSGDGNRGTVSKLLQCLTQWDCVSSIVGLYPIPNAMFIMSCVFGTTQSDYNVLAASQHTSKTDMTNYHNKKLCLYPYSYLRLILPNGDIKELHYEDYINVQSGGDSCEVALHLNYAENPQLLVAPNNYKMNGMSPRTSSINANVNEGVIFNQLPTMPYTIDAFLAQIASVANTLVAKRTTETDYQMVLNQGSVSKQIKGAISAYAAGELASAGGKVGELNRDAGWGHGSVDGSGGLIHSGATAAARYQSAEYLKTQNEVNMYNDAAKALAGGTDNAIYDNFRHSKPAFACDTYVPSNGDGMINYDICGYTDIIFLRVSIMPSILDKYEQYFDHYGYTSGRCGIPRVIRYKEGSSSTAELPQWHTVNGRATTFIKTRDCKITCSMLPVAQFIKAMFDGGVRMIKGDPS